MNDRGVVVPKVDGSTTVRASVGKLHAEMVLDVKNQDKPEPVSFKFQTLPVLSKAGCSMGSCVLLAATASTVVNRLAI